MERPDPIGNLTFDDLLIFPVPWSGEDRAEATRLQFVPSGLQGYGILGVARATLRFLITSGQLTGNPAYFPMPMPSGKPSSRELTWAFEAAQAKMARFMIRWPRRMAPLSSARRRKGVG